MNPFQQFTRLPASTQKRIIKVARQVERSTRGSIKFDDVVEIMTATEYARHEAHRRYRNTRMNETAHYRAV